MACARPMAPRLLVSYRPLAILRVVEGCYSAYRTLLATRLRQTYVHTVRSTRATTNGSCLLVCRIHLHHHKLLTAQTRDEWSHSSSSVCSASATSLRSGATQQSGELKDYAGAAGGLFGTYRIPASLFAGASAGAAFAMPIVLGEAATLGSVVSVDSF